MIKLTFNKNYRETRLESVLIIAICAIVLIYIGEFVRTQIRRWDDEAINVEFQADYEEISACLNESVLDEWTTEDLDAVLLCLNRMEQIDEGGSAFTDELEMDSDVDFFVAPPDHWDEEWGTLEILSMADVDWNAFSAGNTSGIDFVLIFGVFGAGYFDDTNNEAGLILNWIYEHREELTDIEITNEVGTIFAVSVEFETGSCSWENGNQQFCQKVIFYMDEELYQELDDFIWSYILY